MPIYPLAKYREVSGLDKDKVITPIGVILHVRDGLGASLFDYFDGPSGGIESHFYISYNGGIEQYRNTNREADANYKANSFKVNGRWVGFISIETEGLASGKWTSIQLAKIKDILNWLNVVHDIPLVVCPAWNKPGVGYHTMWGAPSQWTPHVKSCPGPKRIQQFKDDIVPWLKNGEDEMTPADWKKLEAMIDAKLAAMPRNVWGYKNTLLEKSDAYQILRDTRNATAGPPPISNSKKLG